MSTENISTHPSKQASHDVRPEHHEAIIRHAVRNIPHAAKLCDSVFNKKKEVTYRLPDDRNDETDGYKHFWS